jgi:hypothetical protein
LAGVGKIVCGGLDGGEGGRFGGGGSFFFFLHHAFDEQEDGAFAFCDLGDVGARGEDTEGWVYGDLFYGFGFCGICGLDFWQVQAGNLEAVEEEAGAAGIDVVGGDTLQDFADGGLDGGAIFG